MKGLPTWIVVKVCGIISELTAMLSTCQTEISLALPSQLSDLRAQGLTATLEDKRLSTFKSKFNTFTDLGICRSKSYNGHWHPESFLCMKSRLKRIASTIAK